MPQRGKSNQGQERPTGTSGRQGGDMNTGITDDNDARRGDTAQTERSRRTRDEDEDSPLGIRGTNR